MEALQNIDITGKQQHGFKTKHSTAAAGLLLQSLVARALDEDNHVILASLDHSAAFDVMNVQLQIKRLMILGLPSDLVELVKI